MKSNLLAALLMLIGALFLLSNFNLIPRFGYLFHQWWPALLIAAGVFMLFSRSK